MKYLIYDNTFEGLLTSIFDYYQSKYTDVKIVAKDKFQPSLFCDTIIIKTDFEKSSRLIAGIKQKLSKYSFSKIIYAFLSEIENCENDILNYLILGFKIGKNLDNNLQHKEVMRMEKLYTRVVREIHLFKGIIRFRKLKNGIYYSSIEPTYYILPALSDFFKNRFRNQSFVIHDVLRKKAIFYQHEKNEIEIIEIIKEEKDLIENNIKSELFADDEANFQILWKSFFNSITIENRKNPKLQMNFMPKKYWKYIIEKNQ